MNESKDIGKQIGFWITRSRPGHGVAPLILAILSFGFAGPAADAAHASRTQWSIFEEQRQLTRTDATTRAAVLDEISALGADTLRVLVSWRDIAPDSSAKQRPAFDADDPAAYPGFAAYDDVVAQATARGLRVLITLGGPAPVWATRDGRGDNYYPSAVEFARFAAATGKRYSGSFAGLPRVQNWTLLNEPNHPQFLKPQSVHNSPSARIYRDLVAKGVPALRAAGHTTSTVLVGELAPGAPAGGPGPLGFLRSWLCLDKKYKRLRGRAARGQSCASFKTVDADGFAIHAYTRPISNYRPRGDTISITVIRRLAKALDKAARAGRLPARLPIYNTEFGIQTNPPDPFAGGGPAEQARIINESEEFSYKYSRLRSYSQYLLYDDPPLTSGPVFNRYRGFQTGLRFTDARQKPAYDAYRFPIVVHRRGSGVLIWGRVRPGTGIRRVRLQRKGGSGFTKEATSIATDASGYFTVTRGTSASYRFEASDGAGNAIGVSRVAKPVRF
ncbi:MAG: cellulase family glycosylhydrolase [Solirubrobacterales bacterium]